MIHVKFVGNIVCCLMKFIIFSSSGSIFVVWNRNLSNSTLYVAAYVCTARCSGIICNSK